jgi:PAS domain S-box-containing protein
MCQELPAAEVPDSDDLNVALQQTEEHFDTLVAGVEDYAIFLLNPKGYVISWNAGAQRIKGYESKEIIGRHFSVFYTREAIERDRPRQVLRIAATQGKFMEEGWRVRKDGSLFWGNITITALRNQNGSLRGFLKITRDLTERQKIEALQKADRSKDIFLATVSHEFRTHLNAILGWTSLMKESPTDEALISQGLEVLQRNSITLSRLVEDLVDISKIAAGTLTLEFEDLDLKQIVVSSVESLRLKAADKGIIFKSFIEIPDEVECRVWGAEVRLQQILANILSNSLKFTPDQGTVTVILKTAKGRAIVVVNDTGVGISPEFLPHAFELFAQGKLAAGPNRGMGLGLPICKHLVQAHQGTLSIASDGPGRGTTVKVELPLLASGPSRSIELKEVHAFAKEEAMPETRLEKIRVLAVDDDADL